MANKPTVFQFCAVIAFAMLCSSAAIGAATAGFA